MTEPDYRDELRRRPFKVWRAITEFDTSASLIALLAIITLLGAILLAIVLLLS